MVLDLTIFILEATIKTLLLYLFAVKKQIEDSEDLRQYNGILTLHMFRKIHANLFFSHWILRLSTPLIKIIISMKYIAVQVMDHLLVVDMICIFQQILIIMLHRIQV